MANEGHITVVRNHNIEYSSNVMSNADGAWATFTCKIEKVPRSIRGEKSSQDMASSRNLVSTIGALASPKMRDGILFPESVAPADFKIQFHVPEKLLMI